MAIQAHAGEPDQNAVARYRDGMSAVGVIPLNVAEDDLYNGEEFDVEDGEIVMLPTRHHGTFYVRVTKYHNRTKRAETDALLGSRTLSMVPRLIPRRTGPLIDDARWRSPETRHGFSLVIAGGQSSTGLRYLEIPGVENETSIFGRAALAYSIDGPRLRAWEQMQELGRKR